MRYTWDETKNEINKAKHLVGFELAEALFDSLVVEIVDDRFDYGETRVNAFGHVAGRLFVCTYTLRGDARHIISFRKCNSRETNRYG